MNRDDDARIAAARESFTGKTLTSSQFDEARLICGIIKRKIEKAGVFRETLTDYAQAYARSERLDTVRAETIIRDIFKELNGQSMNAMREALVAAEIEARGEATTEALYFARRVPDLIKQGQTMPFYLAFDAAGTQMAEHLRITEQAAKSLMKEVFEGAEGRDLYEVGKEVEAAYHQPVREAERLQRKADAPEKHQTYHQH